MDSIYKRAESCELLFRPQDLERYSTARLRSPEGVEEAARKAQDG